MTRSTSHAIFPGSFDPMTNGHIDIIHRTLKIFDQLTIAILKNPDKSALFTVEERATLIEAEFASHGDRVKVTSFSGLLVQFAAQIGASVVIRGLRAISDYDYEAQMALMNRSLSGDIETVFLIAREDNSYISSSIVKQVALLGGDITKFVPAAVQAAVKRRVTTRN